MPIPKTEEEARAWLIVNDAEAADFWRYPVAQDLIQAYWDNVLDFGPEPDYTAVELGIYHDKLAARADRLISYPNPVGKTFKVLVRKVEFEYYYIQATSQGDAIVKVQDGLNAGEFYRGRIRVEEASEPDAGEAESAEECS